VSSETDRIGNERGSLFEKKPGQTWCPGFMWMGRVNRINLDKHGINRTYLNLDGAGTATGREERGAVSERISTRNW
jgi:hypothetical protein